MSILKKVQCLVLGHKLWRVDGNCLACRRCGVNRFVMPS